MGWVLAEHQRSLLSACCGPTVTSCLHSGHHDDQHPLGLGAQPFIPLTTLITPMRKTTNTHHLKSAKKGTFLPSRRSFLRTLTFSIFPKKAPSSAKERKEAENSEPPVYTGWMATYLVTSPLWPLEDIASLPQVPAPLYTALGHPSQTR